MNRLSSGPTKFTFETEYPDKVVTITGEASTVSFEHKVDYADVHTYESLAPSAMSEKVEVTMEVTQPYSMTVKEKRAFAPPPVTKVIDRLPPQEVVLWKK